MLFAMKPYGVPGSPNGVIVISFENEEQANRWVGKRPERKHVRADSKLVKQAEEMGLKEPFKSVYIAEPDLEDAQPSEPEQEEVVIKSVPGTAPEAEMMEAGPETETTDESELNTVKAEEETAEVEPPKPQKRGRGRPRKR